MKAGCIICYPVGMCERTFSRMVRIDFAFSDVIGETAENYVADIFVYVLMAITVTYFYGRIGLTFPNAHAMAGTDLYPAFLQQTFSFRSSVSRPL